ncbi:MAG: RNA methyltransferase [Sulfurovaceae bacterium]|nr:RNA methyltransferase [Sulfurovaceae bacterium]MDD5549190.1 RNA methyltransferase [Sulfurovaceae bacterium]
MQDSQDYIDKKAKLAKTLTIYGRNAVNEALIEPTIIPSKLHLSTSNKDAKVIDDMLSICKKRGVEIAYHDKLTLSRISKNAKQDQGVALDIQMDNFINEDEFIANNINYKILAIDGVSNPQNLGMIIRSAAAGNIDAIVIPSKGTSSINPLVIKASVGAIFKIPIIQTNNLEKTLKNFQSNRAKIYTLSLDAKKSYKEIDENNKAIFVLGNETNGVSKEIQSLSDESIIIPMNRGVESLNVAVTASLLAFM